jgi:hypothetical protein
MTRLAVLFAFDWADLTAVVARRFMAVTFFATLAARFLPLLMADLALLGAERAFLRAPLLLFPPDFFPLAPPRFLAIGDLLVSVCPSVLPDAAERQQWNNWQITDIRRRSVRSDVARWAVS